MTGLKRTLRSRHGFTLVELIVVLVILGVVAAFAVPALTGYIDTAHEKQAVSEAQACVAVATDMGAQQYAAAQQYNVNASMSGAHQKDDLHGWSPTNSATPAITDGDVVLTEGTGQYRLHVSKTPRGSFPKTEIGDVIPQMQTQAGVSGTIDKLTFNSSGQLLYLVYTSKGGIQVVYTNTGSTSSVDIGNSEAVVVPTPKKDDSSGGDSGGGGTGGGESGGGETPGGGEAETPTLTVTIKKVNADDQSGLANAQLQILKNGTAVKEIVSSVGGNPVTLEAGSYTLHESAAPSGYDTAADIPFKIVKSGTALTLQVDNGVRGENDTIIMQDTRKEDSNSHKIFIHIQDGTTQKPLPVGTSFILEREGGGQRFTAELDANGNIVLPVVEASNIPSGTDKYLLRHSPYYIKETKAPDGYQELQSSKFLVNWDSYWDSQKNQEVFKGFLISKNDYANNEIVDNSSGTITINRYPVARLYIQCQASSGLSLSDAAFTLGQGTQSSLSLGGKDRYSVAVKLHPGDSIQDDAYLDLSKDYSSNFTLSQTVAPDGYRPASAQVFSMRRGRRSDGNAFDSFDFAMLTTTWNNGFRYDTASHTLFVTNEEIVCRVAISKKDSSGTLLPGAELSLYGGNGALLQTLTTYGSVQTLNLKPGNYQLKETKAPKGYLSAASVLFTITNDMETLDVPLVDPKLTDETVTGTIPAKGATLSYTTTNWGDKLSDDNLVTINKELLLFNKNLYFCKEKYTGTNSLSNPNRTAYKDYFTQETNGEEITLPLPPDPIQFLNSHGKKGDTDIVMLTGRTVMLSESSAKLTRGDLLVDVNKKKAYVYFGTEPLSVGSVKTDDNLTYNLYHVGKITVNKNA